MFNKDLFLLATGQALTSTVIALLTSISSLSGAYLSPYPSLSTLPVTASTLGTLVMIYSAASLMGNYGRRTGFAIKALLGMFGGTIAIVSIVFHSFALLNLGTFLLGMFAAFGQYYRFAALDITEDHKGREHALTIIMGAGVLGGFLGPLLGSHYSNVFHHYPFTGAFFSLTILCLLLLISQLGLSPSLGYQSKKTRKIGTKNESDHLQTKELWKTIPFWMVTLIGACSAAAMTLIMNASPLAMQDDGYSIHLSSIALQAHFMMMYLPSFIQPVLLRYITHKGLILVGTFAGIIGCLLGMIQPSSLCLYVILLGLAGISWSLMTNGSTLLLAGLTSEQVSVRAQGINTTAIYIASLISSLGAGMMLSFGSWYWLSLITLLILILAIPCLLLTKQRSPIPIP